MNPNPKRLFLYAAGMAFALLAYVQTGVPAAQPALLPFLLLEAATFGAGMVFLAGAWPALRDSVVRRRAARVAHASAAWMLLTWVPSDTLDLHFGHWALDALFSSHAYHASLVACGLGLAYYVRELVRERRALLAAASPEAVEAALGPVHGSA